MGQGALTVGGFVFQGQAASVHKNHVTVGRVVGGGLVEREARGEVLCKGHIRLLLKTPDDSTAGSIAWAINVLLPGQTLPPGCGHRLGGGPSPLPPPHGVLPERYREPGSGAGHAGAVVINERTGTVVAGESVKISTVAIAHGNLSVVTGETPIVSQPGPFSKGKTVVVPRTGPCAATEQGAAPPCRPEHHHRRRPGCRPQRPRGDPAAI